MTVPLASEYAQALLDRLTTEANTEGPTSRRLTLLHVADQIAIDLRHLRKVEREGEQLPFTEREHKHS